MGPGRGTLARPYTAESNYFAPYLLDILLGIDQSLHDNDEMNNKLFRGSSVINKFVVMYNVFFFLKYKLSNGHTHDQKLVISLDD